MSEAERFVDTNLFIRHLTNDEPVQALASRRLFKSIEAGRQMAWTTILVVAEVVFVLSNRQTYNLDREQIRTVVLPLLDLPGLEVGDKSLLHRAFDLYTGLRIEFADAYHAALVERRQPPELYRFDRHFDRVTTVRRIEPSADSNQEPPPR